MTVSFSVLMKLTEAIDTYIISLLSQSFTLRDYFSQNVIIVMPHAGEEKATFHVKTN